MFKDIIVNDSFKLLQEKDCIIMQNTGLKDRNLEEKQSAI
jgi:hypothetical protein